MAITLNFACNNPNNGAFVGRFDRMDLDAGTLHMEFEGGDEVAVAFDFPIAGGYGTVIVGDKKFLSYAYHEWYGNWCWNAGSFAWTEALAIINHLGREHGWRMTEGPCELFEAYNERHQITPMEWKAENERVTV